MSEGVSSVGVGGLKRKNWTIRFTQPNSLVLPEQIELCPFDDKPFE
jgi:hypothetical protein